MRKLSHQEILTRQEERMKAGRLPFTVILNDIRSLYNVGSIFRTADGAGVEKLWLCGITGFPPSERISKTALGAEERVSWEYHPDPCTVIQRLKKRGYQIVLLEQMEPVTAYEDFMPEGPVCLVLGNEISGVSEELVRLCDRAVEIEMCGIKNSLNVSVAFGVVAYHIRSTFKKTVKSIS